MSRPKSPIAALANKVHIELRKPEFGVSAIRIGDSGEYMVGLKLETKPFDIGHHGFNGAFAELTVAETHRLIKQLERGISLIDREKQMASKPDDARFKDNSYVKPDGHFNDEYSPRGALIATPSRYTLSDQ